ncbi:MAG: hypothetical protein U9O82_00040 [Thermodesulfobacteriota bacterium]|nr:hypothetical protein [Thermodesulfobacteriota bacterium]
MKFNRICVLIVLFVCLSPVGCTFRPFADWFHRGPDLSPAQVGISANFDIKTHSRIAVPPFINEGMEYLDYGLSDKFAMHCIDIGFVVIDRTLLQKTINDLEVDVGGELSRDDLKRISDAVEIDLIVTGIVTYTINVKGDHILAAESIKFIDVRSGEVLISAYCERIKDKSISTEISREIGRKIGLGKIKREQGI